VNPRYILITERGKIPVKKRGPIDGDRFAVFLRELIAHYPKAEVTVIDLPKGDLWATSAMEWLIEYEGSKL
jgi:hypothetical protein